jgi:heavy metal translocating P-type ATPase
MNAGASEELLCAYCGLPMWEPRQRRALCGDADAPRYCCFGCRFAAGVAQETGATGQMRWTLVRLGMGIFFTMNVMMFTLVLWTDDVYTLPAEDTALAAASLNDLLRYFGLVFSLPVMLLLGGPLVENTWKRLRHGAAGSDALLLLGVAAAYLYSVISLLRREGHVYFDVACMVLVAVTLGRWLEAGSRLKTSEALESLERLLPDHVRLLDDAHERNVPLNAVRHGDTLRIIPGERFPTDCRIVSGCATVDQQVVTGESTPVTKTPGDTVNGGALDLDGDVLVLVTALPTEGTLGRMIRSVREAVAVKGPYERLGERLAGWFIPGVCTVAIGTFAGHMLRDDVPQALLASLSVLLIACPCALGLAIPMVTWTALGRASRSQVLFRSGDALTRLASVKAICFDKTGTLTTGQPVVDCFVTDGATAEDEVLNAAFSLAGSSHHGFARAVVDFASPRAGAARRHHAAQALAGRGIQGDFDRGMGRVLLGSPRLMDEAGLKRNKVIARCVDTFRHRNRPLACIGWQGQVRGVFGFREELRPHAEQALAWCRAKGYHVVILTGDSVTGEFALLGGLDVDVRSGLLPDEKLVVVRELRHRWGPVAMVGEGLNDAPALAGADVGIAMGCGADISRQSADICLLASDLMGIPWAVQLSQAAVGTMRRNLLWAFSYNTAGIGLAAMGWLNPIVAAAAMIASSLLVISGSLKLNVWEAHA